MMLRLCENVCRPLTGRSIPQILRFRVLTDSFRRIMHSSEKPYIDKYLDITLCWFWQWSAKIILFLLSVRGHFASCTATKIKTFVKHAVFWILACSAGTQPALYLDVDCSQIMIARFLFLRHLCCETGMLVKSLFVCWVYFDGSTRLI